MIGTFFDKLRDSARQKHWSPDLALGRRGEDLAHRYLKREGYTIVARNYRLASGEAEADLIAWEGDILAFIEVKTRRTEDFGPPERAIGFEKRAHLLRLARDYVRKSGTPWDRVRFDIVTVVLSDPPQIHLFRSAFSS